eukprot:gene23250-1423_t
MASRGHSFPNLSDCLTDIAQAQMADSRNTARSLRSNFTDPSALEELAPEEHSDPEEEQLGASAQPTESSADSLLRKWKKEQNERD